MTGGGPVPGLRAPNVFQSAWVVADLDRALDHWTRVLGVGPFFCLDFEAGPGLTYRGGPGELRMRVAWAQGGDMQIELLEPRSEAPNVYRDLVPAGRSGFHHVGVWADDYERDLETLTGLGWPLAMDSGPAPTRFAYLDTSAAGGSMLELVERSEMMVGTFAKVREAAASWDGSRPVRSMVELFA